MSRCSFTLQASWYIFFMHICLCVFIYVYMSLCLYICIYVSVSLHSPGCSVGRCTIYAVLQRLAYVKEETMANEGSF